MHKRMATIACVFIAGVVGCDNRDADRLARVARCAAEKGEALAVDTGGWRLLQANLDEFALDSRVSARLRWDKTLAGATVQVSANNGEIELKGSVRNEEQRKLAIAIAESTVGVGNVTVFLEIVP